MPQARRGVAKNDGYIKALIYGNPGMGKTYLLATMDAVPEMGRMMFISAEAGEKTIAALPYADDIDIFPVSNYEDFNTIYEFLTVHSSLRDKWVASGKKDDGIKAKLIKAEQELFGIEGIKEPRLYYGVGGDSLTEIQHFAMYMILGIEIKDPDILKIDPQAQIQHWGKNSSLILKLLRAFRGLKYHVVFNALEKKDQDEATGKIEILPSLPGQLAEKVSGMFDLVGRLVTKEKDKKLHRILITQPKGNYVAKDRSGNLGEYVVDPTWQKLYNLWVGK